MDVNLKTMSADTTMKYIKKGKIVFNHPLQRKPNLWSRENKSRLIESVIHPYIIDSITVVVKDDKWYVLDGVQRLSSILSYINDEFSLTKNINDVTVDGKTYIVSGKKFSKLDEEIRNIIESYNIKFDICTNCTEEEEKETFVRKNLQKNLNSAQKVVSNENESLYKIVIDIANHNFMTKLISKKDRYSDKNRNVAREVLMLSEYSKNYNIPGFNSPNIAHFLRYYNDKINEEKVNQIKQAMDKLDESFDEINVNLISAPFVIYSVYWCIRNKKSVSSCIEWLKTFESELSSSEEYNQYCVAGVNSKKNVMGRLNFFKNAIRNL